LIDVTERSSINTLSVSTEINICSKQNATSEFKKKRRYTGLLNSQKPIPVAVRSKA